VEYDHCWGKYSEPDEQLLNWVRMKAWESRNDPDVNPTADVRYLESAHAQRELRSRIIADQEKKKEERDEFNKYMESHWNRKPHSTNGLMKTNSGLYLLN
jgi:hypothetical protein